jgi:RHS repeat-associated protein
VNYPDKQEKSREGIVRNLKFLGQDGAILTAGNSGKVPPGQIIGEDDGKGKGGGNGNPGNGKDNEAFQYYFHPDHLGSTSYITDASGEVYQHLEYFAFGETFVEEHSNRHRTPFLYNGKELDDETGLYYYGARYYDPVTSMFPSVDPLAEKYGFQSAYAYAANNPVRYVDILGMGPGDGSKRQKAAEALFAYRHPVAAVAIGSVDFNKGKNISSIAARLSVFSGVSKNATGEGDQRNALRHGLWQAMITRDFGEDIAEQAGFAHEGDQMPLPEGYKEGGFIFSGSESLSDADTYADLLNNVIGRKVGKQNPNASNKDLTKKLLEVFKDKGMYTVSEAENGYKVERTKITNEQYEKAIENLNLRNDEGFKNE